MQQLIASVGFRGVDSNKAFYVNDIPGMSSELVTAISDLSTVNAFIAKLHATTSERFRRLVMEQISKCAKGWSSTLAKMPRSGASATPVSYTPGSILCSVNCGAGSKYSYVRLTEVAFLAKTAGVGTLNVYKSPFSELVQTIEVEIEVGKNVIPVTFADWTDELINQIVVIELIIGDSVELYELERVALVGDLEVNDVFETLEDSPAFLMPNVTVCSNIDALIDDYATELAASYCYLLATNLLEFKLSSYKLNLFTNSNRANSEQLAEMYPKEAGKALKGIVSTLADEIQSAQRVPFEGVGGVSVGSFNIYENND